MLRSLFISLLLFPLFLSGMEFTFPVDSDHWEGDFADYPVNTEKFYELSWGWDNLPISVESQNGRSLEKGLFLAGNNHSDDLFMFVRRKIKGLQPNTWYAANYSILIESNVPARSVGIGGSPGESVHLKVGASTIEPKKVAVNGYYHLNVDKGNQAQGGESAIVIGDLANETVDPDHPAYLPKKLYTNKDFLLVKSDSEGDLWIFIGTDSGFEGVTKFYLAQVILQLDEYTDESKDSFAPQCNLLSGL